VHARLLDSQHLKGTIMKVTLSREEATILARFAKRTRMVGRRLLTGTYLLF
jgi:hypothetical protein